MNDPLVIGLIFTAGAVTLSAIVGYIWHRRREAANNARRREQLRKQYDVLHVKEQEIARLGARIIATSSTQTIAGFEIQRQIEAVFTDGHRSPAKAVEVLKALAVQKGANALINLSGERLASGKCVARGDAVIVKVVEGSTVPPPSEPEQPGHNRTAAQRGGTDKPPDDTGPPIKGGVP